MSIIRLDLPISEDKIRALKVGDEIGLYGTIATGRDGAHKLMHDAIDAKKAGDASKLAALEWLRPLLRDSFIYHCGPVMKKLTEGPTAAQSKWKVVAAGPTTSIREEPYQAHLIEKYKLRAVIGKGGMGAKTLEACAKFGCVYLHAVGGAAQVLAECVTEVLGVYLEQFGSPEAIWAFRVKEFPVVVTMDAHGNSLHAAVLEQSKERLKQLV